jgi:hypothetical protein
MWAILTDWGNNDSQLSELPHVCFAFLCFRLRKAANSHTTILTTRFSFIAEYHMYLSVLRLPNLKHLTLHNRH